MNTLKELDRYRTGLAYGRTSINNHSIRAFTFKGKTYYLDRTTDCQPRYFQLYTFPPGGGIAQIVKVNGQNFWGDNLSWAKAVQIVQDCLQKTSE